MTSNSDKEIKLNRSKSKEYVDSDVIQSDFYDDILDNAMDIIDGVEHQKYKDDFNMLIDAEFERLNVHCANKLREYEEDLKFVYRKCIYEFLSEEKTELLLSHLDFTISRMLELDKFIGENYVILRKLLKRYEKIFNVPTNLSVARIALEPFCNLAMDHLITHMGDIYYSLMHRKSGNEWEAPTSFQRNTKKYWIRLEDLMTVKMIIARYLPVLIYGEPQGVTKQKLDEQKFKKLQCSTCISSVYFDDDRFSIYRGRLLKEEGAKLIRMRWYGDLKDEIFFEKKTHHTSWVSLPSLKERFSMDIEHVQQFLKGEWHYEQMASQLMREDVDPSWIRDQWALANEIQRDISQLKPKISTVYDRTAFQMADDDSLRISIDDNFKIHKVDAKNWKEISDNPLIFPLAVLEVKVHEREIPEWLVKLLESDMIVSAEKFSKYLHGVSNLYYDHVDELPHWFNHKVARYTLTKGSSWYSYEVGRYIENINMVKGKALPPIEPIQYMPIEPKSFWANERWLTKWIELMILLSFLSVVFGTINERSIQGANTFVRVLCLLGSLYAVFSAFVKRRKMITNDITAFDDQVSPYILILILVFSVMLTGFSQKKNNTDTGTWVNFVPAFFCTGAITLYIWVYGFSTYIWDKYKIDRFTNLGISKEHSLNTKHIFKIAITLTFIISVIALLYIATTAQLVNIPFLPPDAWPVLLILIFIVLLVFPVDVFYLNTRIYLLRIWGWMFSSAFVPSLVTGKTKYLLDVYSSIAFINVQSLYLGCYIFSGGVFTADKGICAEFLRSNSPFYLLFGVPYLLKFIISLTEFVRKSFAAKKLVINRKFLKVGKYLLQLVLITISIPFRPSSWENWTSSNTLFIILSFTYAFISFYIDLSEIGLAKTEFLRDILIFPKPVYYWCYLSFFFIRLSWILGLPEVMVVNVNYSSVIILFINMLRRVTILTLKGEYAEVKRIRKRLRDTDPLKPSTFSFLGAASHFNTVHK